MITKDTLIQSGLLNEIDIVFADYICSKQEQETLQLWMLAAMLSYSVNNGDSAFDSESISGCSLADVFNIPTPGKESSKQDRERYNTLSEKKFITFNNEELLKYSEVIGFSGDSKPIIFNCNLFFLNKFDNYENIVANFIKERIQHNKKIAPQMTTKINDLFPVNSDAYAINWQKVAAILAIKNDFLVISGGPGTGKTTTSGQILTLLLEDDPNLIINMVAPTGKAADRLSESIRKFKTQYQDQLPDSILGKIPEKAETIHKFLGIAMSTPKYSEFAPAPTDLLLIDEASMVSLPLYAATFKALKQTCKVILLGDKDQLMAVENGNVLNDITSAEHLNRFSANFAKSIATITDNALTVEIAKDSKNPMEDVAVQLEHSWRFDQNSGIGHLSRLLNSATTATKSDEISSLIDRFEDVNLVSINCKDALSEYISNLCTTTLNKYTEAVESNDIDAVFQQLSQFRILCALNNTPFGVHQINSKIEQELFPDTATATFYHGQPIMITKNDYRLKLSNGDVGVIFQDLESGELKAFFQASDDDFRKLTPSSMDEYTTAFAISIHKSQGSEFNNVYIILPPEKNPILTKELIYTAVTRAKEQCTVIASPKILYHCAITKMHRTSGLQQKLIQQS